ncbi:MAG: lysophospholipid acyltransferase family protein [Myxococcota bacterium]
MKLFKRWVGQTYLRVSGWQMDGSRPEPRQYVLIAAPHTTNWDLPLMLAMAFVYDIPVRWMGKHTLFKPPFGPFFRFLGGVPIVRHRAGGVVEQMVGHFEVDPDLALLVPAEGTRGYVEYWKSGFYHIARQAEVPVVLSYLDFSQKVGGIGPSLMMSGDIRADMDVIRAFYDGKQGHFPDKVGRIRLREEDETESAAALDGHSEPADQIATHL